ncbi:hypothetical protein D3C74_36140 [compost metagenome]
MQNGSRPCLENLDITRIFGCETRGFYMNVVGYKEIPSGRAPELAAVLYERSGI